jgi:hypothetical protein
MGVESDYWLRRDGDQGIKDRSLIMVRLMMLAIELDDELQFLGRSLCNAIHDSTLSLGAELL